MPHDTPLVSTIVAGLVLAFILGAIANRLKMPPLVGYLVAGAMVGPHTPGFVADVELATELSEIGVILLMFGVGLHFSLKDLLSVRTVAIPGALLRIAIGILMGIGLGMLMGWSVMAGAVFGLALSVSSTVVLIKGLQDRHMVTSERGRIATGWVIVEDIAMILALVLIPAVAALTGATSVPLHDPFVNLAERLTGVDFGIGGVISVTLLKLVAFVGFMFVVGRRLIPMVLHYTAHTGSRELFRLAVLAIALGVAAGAAYLFGVSLALGAFFAGMILSESELSHRAAEESLPLRDAFSVLFFVSVGMLFDPSILLTEPIPVLATLFIIIVARLAITYFTLVIFRQPAATSASIAASLAQIGEFSFILATLGLALGILPVAGQSYLVAGAIISIVLNPALLWLADYLRPSLDARYGSGVAEAAGAPIEPSLGETAEVPPPSAEEEVEHPTALTGHAVLIGYGRVGSVVADGLQQAGQAFLVIEDAEARIVAARKAGLEVIVGNAAASHPLKLANIEGATTVIVAIPNAFEAGQAVDQCRRANASVLIIARAHSDEEEEHLRHLGANVTIMGEREIGIAMLELVNPDIIAAAAVSPMDAVAAAIAPKGIKPVRTLPREPERQLSDIDEDELARAIGVPPASAAAQEVEPTAEAAEDATFETAAETESTDGPLIEGEAVDVSSEPAAPASEAAVPDVPPAHEAEIVPFKPRRPASTPATPFGGEEAPSKSGPTKPTTPDEAS